MIRAVGARTLGGPDSSAWAINDKGQVVGSADTSEGAGSDRADDFSWCGDGKYAHNAFHAVLWTSGRMRDLGTFGGLESSAAGINNHGQIVGWAEAREEQEDVPGCLLWKAFIWQDGRKTNLGGLRPGAPNSASAINERGQVVGRAGTMPDPANAGEGDFFFHAVLWTYTR